MATSKSGDRGNHCPGVPSPSRSVHRGDGGPPRSRHDRASARPRSGPDRHTCSWAWREVYPPTGPCPGVRDSGAGGTLEPLLEPLDLAGRVDDRLLPGVERVAVAAHVDPELGPRGADRERRAARGAVHLGLVVLGVDAVFHECSPASPSVRFDPPVVDRCDSPGPSPGRARCGVLGQVPASAGIVISDSAAAGRTRTRFFDFAAWSNLTWPVTVAKTV